MPASDIALCSLLFALWLLRNSTLAPLQVIRDGASRRRPCSCRRRDYPSRITGLRAPLSNAPQRAPAIKQGTPKYKEGKNRKATERLKRVHSTRRNQET